MKNKMKAAILIVLAFAGILQAKTQKPKELRTFSYDKYAAVLSAYVDPNGMVNYKQLKADSKNLDAFVAEMADLTAGIYEKWSKVDKIAFWLNAYNACTLKAIIDNYPIRSSFFKSAVYPKNSIRQIPGVWDKLKFNVMGKSLTLKHIEHNILRKEFDEPRIHTANSKNPGYT